MLDQLETLAADLGIPFTFGSDAEFNVLADDHRDGFILFHNGYLDADVSVTNQKGIRRVHQLVLMLMYPSRLADKPDTRRTYRDLLQSQADQIILRLDSLTMVPFSMRQTMFRNYSDRNLDGIKLTGALTLNELPVC